MSSYSKFTAQIPNSNANTEGANAEIVNNNEDEFAEPFHEDERYGQQKRKRDANYDNYDDDREEDHKEYNARRYQNNDKNNNDAAGGDNNEKNDDASNHWQPSSSYRGRGRGGGRGRGTFYPRGSRGGGRGGGGAGRGNYNNHNNNNSNSSSYNNNTPFRNDYIVRKNTTNQTKDFNDTITTNHDEDNNASSSHSNVKKIRVDISNNSMASDKQQHYHTNNQYNNTAAKSFPSKSMSSTDVVQSYTGGNSSYRSSKSTTGGGGESGGAGAGEIVKKKDYEKLVYNEYAGEDVQTFRIFVLSNMRNNVETNKNAIMQIVLKACSWIERRHHHKIPERTATNIMKINKGRETIDRIVFNMGTNFKFIIETNYDQSPVNAVEAMKKADYIIFDITATNNAGAPIASRNCHQIDHEQMVNLQLEASINPFFETPLKTIDEFRSRRDNKESSNNTTTTTQRHNDSSFTSPLNTKKVEESKDGGDGENRESTNTTTTSTTTPTTIRRSEAKRYGDDYRYDDGDDEQEDNLTTNIIVNENGTVTTVATTTTTTASMLSDEKHDDDAREDAANDDKKKTKHENIITKEEEKQRVHKKHKKNEEKPSIKNTSTTITAVNNSTTTTTESNAAVDSAVPKKLSYKALMKKLKEEEEDRKNAEKQKNNEKDDESEYEYDSGSDSDDDEYRKVVEKKNKIFSTDDMSKFKDTHNDSNIKHHDVPNLYCCKTDDEDKIERYIDTETIAYLAIALTKKGMPDICAFLNEQYGDLMFVPKDLRSYLNGDLYPIVHYSSPTARYYAKIYNSSNNSHNHHQQQQLTERQEWDAAHAKYIEYKSKHLYKTSIDFSYILKKKLAEMAMTKMLKELEKELGISIDDIETALEKATLSANISIEKAVESSNLKDLFINVIAKLDEKFLKMFGKKIIEDCEPVENAEKVVYQISIEWAKILVKQF